MKQRRLCRYLQKSFGARPDVLYAPGDMENIRSYSDFRRARDKGAFLVDDITWGDLDMDRVYRRINPGLSTAGEQYLYYMLRSPALDAPAWARRQGLIRLMAEQPALRLKVQLILSRLGRTHRVDMTCAYAPPKHGIGKLLAFLALAAMIPTAAVLAVVLGTPGQMILMCMLAVNVAVHELGRRHREADYDTVNYAVAMCLALRRLQRLALPDLAPFLGRAYDSARRLRPVMRTGSVCAYTGNPITDTLQTVLLLDLIAYEFLKSRLGRHHADIFVIHETLGQLDAAIAVASYRASLPTWVEPSLAFGQGAPFIDAAGLAHPLMDSAVPNDLHARRPLLLTGSNASGKSTFLKAVALNALLGQTICTCTAAAYRATAFRIMTSMALRDDLLAGESYYIVETRSLRRILAALEEGGAPVLCAVDEVLRGTNTVERIAASCEILQALAKGGALCLAATHDVELCDLLADEYTLAHFEEAVTESAMTFDYTLRPGKATSRNAIRLLRLLGFGDALADRANRRADAYLATGRWR